MEKIFDFLSILNDDCCEQIFFYLDFKSQLQLAKTSNRLSQVFKNFARCRYKDINATLANKLFRSLGNNEFDELLQIIGETVKSYAVPRISKEGSLAHLANVVKNCENLECFTFIGFQLCGYEAYELICQLPRLHRIYIAADKLSFQILDALEAKQGAKIEMLSIKGSSLPIQQVIRICRFYNLRKLRVSCQNVPIKELLRLQQLETLHLTMSSITNKQLMELVSGLPNLRNLQLRKCSRITHNFLVELQDWLSKNRDGSQKVYLYVHGLDANWEGPGEPYYAESKHFVMGTEPKESEPVLLSYKPICTYY